MFFVYFYLVYLRKNTVKEYIIRKLYILQFVAFTCAQKSDNKSGSGNKPEEARYILLWSVIYDGKLI